MLTLICVNPVNPPLLIELVQNHISFKCLKSQKKGLIMIYDTAPFSFFKNHKCQPGDKRRDEDKLILKPKQLPAQAVHLSAKARLLMDRILSMFFADLPADRHHIPAG